MVILRHPAALLGLMPSLVRVHKCHHLLKQLQRLKLHQHWLKYHLQHHKHRRWCHLFKYHLQHQKHLRDAICSSTTCSTKSTCGGAICSSTNCSTRSTYGGAICSSTTCSTSYWPCRRSRACISCCCWLQGQESGESYQCATSCLGSAIQLWQVKTFRLRFLQRE